MKERQGRWSKREMVICLAAYASLKPVDRNSPPLPLIHTLAEKLPLRDIGTIKLRFSNYVNKDPEMLQLGKKGLSGGGAHVQEYWDEFSDENGFVSKEKLLRALISEL